MGRKKNVKSKRSPHGDSIKVIDDNGVVLGLLQLKAERYWHTRPPAESPAYPQWLFEECPEIRWGDEVASSYRNKYSEHDVRRYTATAKYWVVPVLDNFKRWSGNEQEEVQFLSTHFGIERSPSGSFNIVISPSFKVSTEKLMPIVKKLLDNDVHTISLSGLRYALSQQ